MAVALHHRDTGEGPPLVLLHAFPLSSAMWLAQRDGLGADFRVITPDQRGYLPVCGLERARSANERRCICLLTARTNNR